MYELIPLICAVVFIGIGAFMVAAPQAATKKTLRGSSDVVRRTRRNGILVIVLGILLAVIGCIQMTL